MMPPPTTTVYTYASFAFLTIARKTISALFSLVGSRHIIISILGTTRSTIEVAHFDKTFSECQGSLTRNRRNSNLVSKNDVFVYLGNGFIHWDTI